MMDITSLPKSPVVFKIGGSLLDSRQALPRLLSKRIRQECSCRPVLVLFGGGLKVDRIREEHRLGRLSDDQAHWRAIEVMDEHAEQFLPLLPKLARVIDFNQIAQATSSVVVIQVGSALRDDSSLPVGWQVTSDSIAAWVATRSKASRLVLAKSVGETGPFDPSQAQRLGWVDDYFPTISQDLSATGCVLEWFNARQASDTIV
jgi:aspartokinase-like uncharacterized kinase